MKNLPVKAGPFELDRYDLKRKYNPILNDPTGGIISSLAFVISQAIVAVAPGMAGYTAYAVGTYMAMGAMTAASMGLSILTSGLTSPKAIQTSLSRSPHLINTSDTDEVVMPCYGEFRKGCNWVFTEESGGHNKYLNLVLTWAEGLCNGLIYTTDYKPNYTGAGKNDMRIKGTFSGAATREFKVQIDGTGSPNTFKWSVDNGSTWVETGVAMTANWDTLQEGVQIKFGTLTGHTNGDSWTWMAGLGLWVGESLLGLFEAFGSSDKDLADHYWHNGSKTQTVDTNLQTECPLYADANARTCYSYLRLKYNIQAFPSGVQDFFALARWRHLFDPREVAHSSTDETTWAYSNIAVLVALDWVIRRFGMDRPWARVDETSVEAAANWCDANTMTFNGAIINEQSPEDTLRDIELCYRGFHFERDSKLVFGILADDTAVMTFTETDVMIDPEGFVIEIPGIPETPDRVMAWYQEPLMNYAAKQVYYPQDSSLSTLTGLNEMELNLIGVTSRTKATQLAKYHYLRSVYNKTYSLTLSPRSYALEPGDMITVTHSFPNWSATKVRVLGFGIQQDNGWFTFNVIEENSAIYNTDVNVSDDDIFIEPGVYTYPPDISVGSVAAKGDGFSVKITKPSDAVISGYIVYVYTVDTVASSVVIKRISGTPSTATIDLGTIAETGSPPITLTTAIPYYFWATALDENEHESLNKFYLGTATSGVSVINDTTPPTPNPIVITSATVSVQNDRIGAMECKIVWGAATDDSGKNVKYKLKYYVDGTTLIKEESSKEVNFTLKGLDPNKTYRYIVLAYDWQNNYTDPQSPIPTFETTDDDIAPAAPTVNATIIKETDSFKFKFTKNTEDDMKGGGEYRLYVWTLDNSGLSKIVGEVAHPKDTIDVPIGRTTYSGAGDIILAYNTNYWFYLTAVDRAGNESAKTRFSASAVNISGTPANPTNIVLTVKADEFQISFKKSTADDMKGGGYLLYCNTSNSVGDSKRIGDVSHSADKFNIKIGAVTYEGDGPEITIAWNTSYWFWVITYTRGETLAAAFAATSPTSGKLFKNEWFRSFENPWHMKNKATYHYKRTTAGTTTHSVSSGKVALLEGYAADVDGGAPNWTATIYLTDSVAANHILENVTATTIVRAPSFTNGIYLPYGCAIKLTLTDNGGGGTHEAKMKIIEFDEDSIIVPIFKSLNSGTSYTVTAGKGLTVTFVWSNYSGCFLQQYLNSAWENIWDAYLMLWDITKGCLYFPPGAVIDGSLASASNIQVIGYETSDA